MSILSLFSIKLNEQKNTTNETLEYSNDSKTKLVNQLKSLDFIKKLNYLKRNNFDIIPSSEFNKEDIKSYKQFLKDFHNYELNEIINGNLKISKEIEFVSDSILNIVGEDDRGIIVDGAKLLPKEDLFYEYYSLNS